MTVTVAQRAAPVARQQPTVEEQKDLANAAGAALEMLASRLAANDGFAEEFAAHPKSALGGAGIVLQKEGVEFLMMHDPARFDILTDKLFALMSPDTLTAVVAPSCDSIGIAE